MKWDVLTKELEDTGSEKETRSRKSLPMLGVQSGVSNPKLSQQQNIILCPCKVTYNSFPYTRKQEVGTESSFKNQ